MSLWETLGNQVNMRTEQQDEMSTLETFKIQGVALNWIKCWRNGYKYKAGWCV